ncbi:MAG: C2H2-type zinc finger protein [Candidatus Omnitrophica bacterium]|nr:C2H2-type zinc finger protein [Candidatus Omnitrophota bacterium]
MIIIKNQTLYQCEDCKKRFMSKASVKRHQKKYCTANIEPDPDPIVVDGGPGVDYL